MVKRVGMLNCWGSLAVLTLPGIAGIVLTMGTAVDANIIIMKEPRKNERWKIIR
jgi:SecD/SecF fusion protein